jgi:hypothetical protein
LRLKSVGPNLVIPTPMTATSLMTSVFSLVSIDLDQRSCFRAMKWTGPQDGDVSSYIHPHHLFAGSY